MHEFGHSLACRQVGGKSEQIVLWPLGGVAYVDAPSRPGAMLWSIAAGPLVNVVLLPLTFVGVWLAARAGWENRLPDAFQFIEAVTWMNLSLLIFNLLPVYPLDGGQILRSLLWFPLGNGRSLMVATLVGLAGGLGLMGLALWKGQIWLGVVTGFLAMRCWKSFRHTQALRAVEKLPRRAGHGCPVCQSAPPIGAYWRCRQCSQPFDTFASGAICPQCQTSHEVTRESVVPIVGSVDPRRVNSDGHGLRADEHRSAMWVSPWPARAPATLYPEDSVPNVFSGRIWGDRRALFGTRCLHGSFSARAWVRVRRQARRGFLRAPSLDRRGGNRSGV